MRKLLHCCMLFTMITGLCAGQDRTAFRRLGDNAYSFPEKDISGILKPADHRAFFYGETHTRNFEPSFKYELIVYLTSQRGVRHVFMEFGYSAAVLFNAYLATGDTTLLDLDILYTSPYYILMWKRLYAFNQALPQGERLIIHGIDFESPKTFYKALVSLAPATATVPAELKDIIREIRLWAAMDSRTLAAPHTKNQKKIRRVFDRHRDKVNAYYGTNAPEVMKMVANDFKMTDRSREARMYENLQRELKSAAIERFVGFLGGDHVNYSNKGGLPARLEAEAAYKGAICSIRMFCFDAVDNWSGEKVDCLGTYEEQECSLLRAAYLGEEQNRAVLVGDSAVEEVFLKGTADCYLFAQDN